jgi:dihydroorotate dehydrogenase electron transfer subunit
MVWVPGDDEVPMSLSYVGAPKGITVKAMGSTSARMLELDAGAPVGIRGPYGNAFDLSARRILVVGGGSGSAVLAPAAEAARAAGAKLVAAAGATTERELLFAARFGRVAEAVHIATDDGSAGHHGYVTDVAARLLAEEPFDAVWTCGPEVMMRKVALAARDRGVPVFCSVERHMKCGLGLCDACALGPYHVCADGPVFPAEKLLPQAEFGFAKRDPAGRRVPH